MNISEQTFQQIDRAIRKIVDKYPTTVEATLMTDIHIRVTQETGEMVAYNDDDVEINRCVVEQWINNADDNFYEKIDIRKKITEKSKALEKFQESFHEKGTGFKTEGEREIEEFNRQFDINPILLVNIVLKF